MTKFYSMFVEFFKELDRVHACSAVATTHQRGEWTHHPRGAMVIDMDYSNSDDEDIFMPPLIYPEDSDNKESLIDPPSAEPTPQPVTPIEKPTKEPIS